MGIKKKTEFNKAATARLWEVVAQGSAVDDPRVAEALADGANPNADDWEGHETPLLMAILMRRPGAAQILLSKGADTDKSNDYDQRPLELAGAMGAGNARDMVNLLIQAGAKVDAVNTKGWTALMHACDVGDKEGALALLDAGADIEHTDSKGWTPLAAAVYGSDWAAGRACLEMLVDRGAKVTESGVKQAQAWGRHEVAQWLKAIYLARAERVELEAENPASKANPRAGVRL